MYWGLDYLLTVHYGSGYGIWIELSFLGGVSGGKGDMRRMVCLPFNYISSKSLIIMELMEYHPDQQKYAR